MGKFIIRGGKELHGEITIQSAKNAMLPLISACILLETKVTFLNCQKLSDIVIMLEIIKELGGDYSFDGDKLSVDCTNLNSYDLPCELTKKVRASVFMSGPLLARFKKATMCAPGGCNIGVRPIDMHIEGLKNLGAQVCEDEIITFSAKKLKGSEIWLKYKSVGVTENLIMASVFAEGTTKIINAAQEPEIVCLARFLKCFGAKIYGEGTSTVVIEGVKKLSKQNLAFKPIGDRIEAGTFILATLNTGGELQLNNAEIATCSSLIKKIFNKTCKIHIFNDKIYIKSKGSGKGLGFIRTSPYPGFPTDLQSPLCAYASTLYGETLVEEGVFKDRFTQLGELVKMGANIKIDGQRALIKGVKQLVGKEVYAYDLRGGAAMIIAGLKAEGETSVLNAEVVDRGYYLIHDKLYSLGADIKRI